jgi:hypothetical protein
MSQLTSIDEISMGITSAGSRNSKCVEAGLEDWLIQRPILSIKMGVESPDVDVRISMNGNGTNTSVLAVGRRITIGRETSAAPRRSSGAVQVGLSEYSSVHPNSVRV